MLHVSAQLFSAPTVLAWGMPNGIELLMIMGFGLLIFGKRLPEVGRGLGKSIVEFKKGLKGIEDEVSQVDDVDHTKDQLANRPQTSLPPQTTVQQYDPFTGKPITTPVTPSESGHG